MTEAKTRFFFLLLRQLILRSYLLAKGKIEKERERERNMFWARWFNGFIRFLRYCCDAEWIDALFGMKLEASYLIEKARAETGLEDLGIDFKECEVNLHTLLNSARTEARLSPLGQFLLAQRVRSSLRCRLKAEALFQRFPEILEKEKLLPAIFIISLPRTGSTFLHRLVARDIRFYSLFLWEALNPACDSRQLTNELENNTKRRKCNGMVPWILSRFRRWLRTILSQFSRWLSCKLHLSSPIITCSLPSDPKTRGDERYEHAQFLRVVLHLLLGKGISTIHECEMEAPEEETILMDLCFGTQLSEALYHVPSFAQRIQSQDPTSMYRYLRKMLLLLQWQKRRSASSFSTSPEKWILKSPNHLEWWDTVHQIFPESKFVYLHRDSRSCYLSAFYASSEIRQVFSDQVDKKEVAQHWYRKLNHVMRKSIESKRKIEREGKTVEYISVSYEKLMEGPLQVTKEVTEFAGLSWREEDVRRCVEYITKQKTERQQQRQESKPSFSQFGYQDEHSLRPLPELV